jgi:hypothetical protein
LPLIGHLIETVAIAKRKKKSYDTWNRKYTTELAKETGRRRKSSLFSP